MNDITRFIQENDHFARMVGIEVIEAEPGRAVARLELTENHINLMGTAHGAALFALAAAAFGAAANAYGTKAFGVETRITFFKPSLEGVLTATASEISRGRKLAVYGVEIHNQANDRIASFQGTAYCTDAPLDFGGSEER